MDASEDAVRFHLIARKMEEVVKNLEELRVANKLKLFCPHTVLKARDQLLWSFHKLELELEELVSQSGT